MGRPLYDVTVENINKTINTIDNNEKSKQSMWNFRSNIVFC